MPVNFRLEAHKEEENLKLYPITNFSQIVSYNDVYGYKDVDLLVIPPSSIAEPQKLILSGLDPSMINTPLFCFSLELASQNPTQEELDSFNTINVYNLVRYISTDNLGISLYRFYNIPTVPITIRIKLIYSNKDVH